MRHRIDANQHAIVKTLRKAGCNVLSLAAVGNGCPDLLVYRRHKPDGTYRVVNPSRLYMLEIKDGNKPPSKRKLTPHQIKFRERWPVQVVCSEEEALRAVGL